MPSAGAGSGAIAGINVDAVSNLLLADNTIQFGNSGVAQGIYFGSDVEMATTQVSNNQTQFAIQSIPSVVIATPGGVMTAPGTVTIQGTASEGNGILGVTVNGISCNSGDGYAHWTASVPIAVGSNVITAVATDFSSPSATATASIQILGSLDANGDGLGDVWETQYGATGGPLGDPSRSGIPNLVAYALNLNPNAPARSLLPNASLQVKAADGRKYLTFSYRRWIGGGGLAYTVEVSSDMISWTDAGSNIEEVNSPVANGDGTEIETVRLLPAAQTPGNPRQFMRLKITAP